jgi:hypothetical protein
MNLSVKRCLLGLVAWATMFGIARAQFNEPAGTVQIGPPAINGGQVIPQGPSSVTDYGAQPLPSGAGSLYGMSSVDRVFAPRVNIDSRGGALYGYGYGYSNIGIFAPYKIDEDSILFVHGMGMITYDSRGGASVGTGWRHWMEGLDRIVGFSVWFDFDNGHAQPYQQVGLSFESLGRYVDYRVNGYIPISNADHVLYSQLTQNTVLYGSGIGLIRNNTVEQSYTGFDAETGGPVPFLGRYGLNAYLGGYYFTGNGQKGGDFTGVSGRLLSQINEDVSFGVQVTDDHVFGLNTQFQVFVNLPNGKPGRWFRNPRVHDRLVQNVFRQNRVIAKTSSYTTTDVAIDPNTHRPYFVANINPNLATGGNGMANSPFNSIAQYEALPLAQRQHYDVILVQPRTDASNTNLDTTNTLVLFDGQRLLSTSIAHTFTTDNLSGVPLTMPGTTGGSAPMLFNSSGMDVITLAGGNSRGDVPIPDLIDKKTGNVVIPAYVPYYGIEVSGFDISGSKSGNGIYGRNNSFVNINNDNIHAGLNGVFLNNLTGSFPTATYPLGYTPPVNKDYPQGYIPKTGYTPPSGTQSSFTNNNIHDNVSDGINITNHGSPPFVNPLEIVVQGNTFHANGNSGLKLNAEAGASIGGIIGGANVAATTTTAAVINANTFSNNSANGLELDANGGTLHFQTKTSTTTPTAPPGATVYTPPTFGVINNVFTANTFDGLHIYTTNNSASTFNVVNNSFGLASTSTTNNSATGNQRFGIGLISDSGTTDIIIGGQTIKNADGSTSNPGNTFNFNVVSAIDLAVSGTAALTYDITNNTISNSASVSTPAPHDAFSFSFNGISGTAPFTITNLSDPGVNITSVLWDLTGTPANIAKTNQGLLGTVNPVVLQPINDTLLTSLNGRNVIAGSSPLLMTATNLPATNANSGLAANTQLLPMGFTGFAPKDVFNATARFEQNGGSTPLTSAATNSSLLTVTFSNGLTATGKVNQPLASSVAVEASGGVFGSSTPGAGNGGDGIHVIASGNSTIGTSNARSSIIDTNTVTGYGGFGIHVETAGTATASNILIQNNTLSSNGKGVVDGKPTFTGGGLEIGRHDSSSLNAVLDLNTISSNFNYGLVLSADGTATGGLNVYSHDNTITNNANNGLLVQNSGDAVLTYSNNRDTVSGNGSASGENSSTTGGDNLSIVVNGNAVENITLTNFVSSNTSGNGVNSNGLVTGSGLSATTNDHSTLNLLIQTIPDTNFTGMSSFSNNKVNGIVLNSNGTSYMHASIYDTLMNGNGVNGILFNRTTASLVRANIVDSFMQGNGVNGLRFYGLGSDPQDPNQQFTGTPNRINLIGDSLNNNGLNGVGQGARIDLCGDSLLVLNANNTTFNSNAQNGLRISLAPKASFGYELGNERSTLDNVQINDNGSNGIFVTSTITPTDVANNNPFLTYDAPSITFMQVSANTGSTEINHNGFGVNPTGLSGILMQYLGGNHDVLIEGDVVDAVPLYSTVIQGNAGDGIHMQAGLEATATVSVDQVLIGGPDPTNANHGNGINFEALSRLVIVDGAQSTTWVFSAAGKATLNVNDSIIQGNTLNGINLHGNDFADNANGTGSGDSEGNLGGLLNANITKSHILNNGVTGINILLEGNFGDFRYPGFASGNYSTFNISNNVIENNGNLGVRMELNAGYTFTNEATRFLDSNAGVNPPIPFNPNDPEAFNGGFFTNTGVTAPILDVLYLSNYLWLPTTDNAKLTLDDNIIQCNGTNKNLRAADGVFIRVSTESYLAADIQRNTISCNVANDLHIESFVQYNPQNGLAWQPLPSIRVGPPALSTVYWDYTAQLDLRLIGNTGNTVNIQSPLVNTIFINGIYSPLQGNTSPNGAFLGARNATVSDPLKDNFSYANPSPRLVQLFQIDDANALNTTNNFQQNGITQDLFNAFQNADFNMRAAADPLFPNPLFPLNYATNPGNPFLP